MYDKAAYDSLVTSDEAMELSQFRTLKDAYIAKDIYQKCIEKDKDDICYSWALGIVWNAGRMQGIREERAKRR